MPKLRVLTALDRAATQCYHFKAIGIAGLGFFTDAYDLFAIVSITNLLGRIYYFDPGTDTHPATKPGTLPPGVYGALTGMAYCGAFCGQLFFGWAGDRLGRRKVYGITLVLMMICSINCGLSYGKSAKGVIATLCFFRFWLGFGVGGDYPLSATLMSEYSNTRTRGAFVAAVFAMQGLGLLGGAAVTLSLSAIFKAVLDSPPHNVNATPPEADYLWRTVFMLGAIPAAATYYYRMRMPETARYTALVLGNEAKAIEDMEGVLIIRLENGQPDLNHNNGAENRQNFGLFSREFAKRHGRELLGVTVCWFMVDVVFYSLNLYQSDLFSSVGWLPKPERMSGLEETYKISRAQALIAVGATVPGYWFTVATIDRIGRKTIQLVGFTFMTIFMVTLAADYKHLKGHAPLFVALYALTFFFANFGPNATTFIIPAELFPSRLRTTCNGIAAAAGKAGAIVGAFAVVRKNFTSRTDVDSSSQMLLGLIAICNFIGFGFTFLLPETTGKTLEELSGESTPDEAINDDGAEMNGAEMAEDGRLYLLRRDGSTEEMPSPIRSSPRP
ncbi:unnamed protein product [Calypogeia fissa]